METRTFLHVVYAGRGDAFMVEYLDTTVTPTARRLIMVDGGPTNYHSGTRAMRRELGDLQPPSSPYYRYLLATCESVWQRIAGTGSVFRPDAMWISHPHQDHYGGLLQLLLSQLPNKHMSFAGPIYVPYLEHSSGWAEVDVNLRLLGFIPTFAAENGLGVTVDFPPITNTAEQMVTYRVPPAPPGPRPPLGRDFSPDQSLDNVASVLMRHDVCSAGTTLRSRIYFTGDGVGSMILPEAASLAPIGAPVTQPPISIYKIQHHGSLRNAQSTVTDSTVSAGVAGEAQMLGVLFWHFNGHNDRSMLPYYNILSSVDDAQLQRLYEALVAYWPTTGLPDMKSTALVLFNRHKAYLKLAQDPNTTDIKPVDDIIWRWWNRFERAINSAVPENPYFFHRDGRLRFPREWWKLYCNDGVWKDKYLAVLTTTRVCQFFSGFVASSYVVSCNGSYGHVSAETVVGLAFALYTRGQAATLYVTDGASVDVSQIQFLCDALSVNMSTILNKSALSVRFLAGGGAFMTLDAGVGVGSDARDATGVTALLDTTATYANLSYLRGEYQQDKTVLPERALGNDKYIFAAQPVDGTWVSLDIDATTQLPVLSAVLIQLHVLEAWEADMSQYNDLQLTTTTTPPRTANIYYSKEIVRTVGWYQILWQDSSLLQWSIYIASDHTCGIYPTTAVPAGMTPLSFQVQPVPAVTAATAAGAVPLKALFREQRVPDVNDTTRTLRQYLTDASVAVTATLAASDCLVAIAGDDSYPGLGLSSPAFLPTVLGLQPDLDASTVDYDYSGSSPPSTITTTPLSSFPPIELAPTAAALTLLMPPSGLILTIDNSPIQVSSVTVDVQWPAVTDPTLSVSVTISGASGVSVTVSRRVPHAARTANLARFLSQVGFAADAAQTLTAGGLLAFLMDNEDRMLAKMSRVPAGIAVAGLMLWKLDVAASWVDGERTPLGGVAVREAHLVAALPSSPPLALELAGVSLAVEQVSLSLRNAQMGSSESLTLAGSAIISTPASSAQSAAAIVSLAVDLEEDVTRLTCTLQVGGGAADIPDLLKFLPTGAVGMGSAVVPFKGAQLSTLATSGAGFVVSQPVAGAQTYVLESVFAAASFTDWTKFLPTGFPVSGDGSEAAASVKLEVLYPLDSNRRTVRAAVDFQVSIAAATGGGSKLLDVVFVAQPLLASGSGRTDDYEFRVGLGSAAGSAAAPASLAEILTGMHMGDLVTAVGGAIPVVGNVLNAVSVNTVSASVVRDGASGEWLFGDWFMDVNVTSWELVSGVLTIDNARIRCSRLADEWTCEAEASFTVGDQFQMDVGFRVPTKILPGYISIDNPNGLNATQLLQALALPDLSGVPVVGALLDTVVSQASITLGYKKAAAGKLQDTSSLSVLGGSIQMDWDQLSIGFIHLAAVQVSLMYKSADDPLGTTKEQKLFSVEASLVDSTFNVDLFYEVQLQYDSLLETITGSMRPLKITTVAQTVGMLLGGVKIPNDLLPLVGTLNTEVVSITLSSVDLSVKSFTVSLVAGASVNLNTVQLSALSLVYTAAAPAQGNKPAVDESYVLSAHTTGPRAQADIYISCVKEAPPPPPLPTPPTPAPPPNTAGQQSKALADPPPTVTMFTASLKESKAGQCTLTGLMDLFGITKPTYPSPHGLETDFFDLEIVEASAKLSLTGSSGSSTASEVQLESLKIFVQTAGSLTILDTPPVTLDMVQFELDYSRTGTTTGAVSGGVSIELSDQTTLYIWAQYDGTSYAGTASLLPSSAATKAIDFRTLAAQWLQPADYQMPTNPAPPASLPCTAFAAVLVPHVSFEVAGYAATTDWSFTVAGVDVAMTGVGGRVLITRDQAAKTSSYAAYLYGDLSFAGFGSSAAGSVALRIGKDQPTVLTAKLVPSAPPAGGGTGTGNTQMADLTAKLGVGTDSAWSALLPSGTNPIAYGDYVFLWVDFAAAKFAVFGSVQGMGSGVLLGRPRYTSTSGRGWLFSLAVTDVKTLLPGLGDVLGAFNFVEVGAELMSLDGPVVGLKADLQQIATVAAEEGVSIASTVPTLASFGTQSLTPGMSLYAVVDLAGSGVLSSILGLGANDKGSSAITVSALLLKDDPASSTFGVTVDHFRMLGGAVVVTATGTYIPANKTTKSSSSLEVDGDITLTLDAKTTLDLAVHLRAQEGSLTFSSTATGTVVQPFGGMLGVTITDVSVSGTVINNDTVKDQVDYCVAGKVHLGSATSGLDFDASILFSSYVPTVAQIGITKSISVTDLLADVIPALAWPAGFDPIVFEVPSALYYSKSDVNISGAAYATGYNIASNVRFFGLDFVVTANLSTVGVVVNAAYNGSINLGFINLGGYTDSGPPPVTYTGPSVQIDTTKANNTVYKARAGIVFFCLTDFLVDLDIAYQTSDRSWTGTATLKNNFFGVVSDSGTVSASVSYRNGQWQIDNMPFLCDMKGLLDLAKVFMDATSDADHCKKLLNLVFTEAITTKWNLSLGNARGDDTGSLHADITGTYDISIAGHTIVGVAVPTLPITIAGAPFTAARLLDIVSSSILQSTRDIGIALFNQPKAVVEILSAVAVTNFGEDVLTNLLCHDFDAENVMDEAAKKMDDGVNDLGQPDSAPNQASSAAGRSTSAGSASASSSLLSGALGLLGAAGAGVASLTGLIDNLKKNESDPDKIKHAEEQRAKAEDILHKAETDVTNAQTAFQICLNLSGRPKSAFVAPDDNKVVLSWDQVLPNKPGFDYEGYANFTWRVRYSLTDSYADGTTVWPEVPSDQHMTITDDKFLYVSTVYAWVEACYTDPSASKPQPYYSNTPSNAENAVHVPAIQPVPPFTFALLDSLTCVVQLPAVPAGLYLAQIIDADYPTVVLGYHLVTHLQDGATWGITLPVQSLTSPSTVSSATAQVQVVSSDPVYVRNSPWTTSSSPPLPVINPPGSLAATTDHTSSALLISWLQTTTSSADYDLVIAKHDGTWSPGAVEVLQPNPPPGTTIVSVTGGDIKEGTVLDIAVRPTPKPATTTAPTSINLFAWLTNYTVHLLPQPTITADSYYDLGSQTLVLRWSLVSAPPDNPQWQVVLTPSTGPSTTLFPAGPVISYDPLTYGVFVPWTAIPVGVQVGVATSTGSAKGPLSAVWNVPPPPAVAPALAQPTVAVRLDVNPASGSPVLLLVAGWSADGSRAAATGAGVAVVRVSDGKMLASATVAVALGEATFGGGSPGPPEDGGFFVLADEEELKVAFTGEVDAFHGVAAEVAYLTPSGLGLAGLCKAAQQVVAAGDAWDALAWYLGPDGVGQVELLGYLLAGGYAVGDAVAVLEAKGAGPGVDWAAVATQLRAVETAFVPLVNPPTGHAATPRNAIRLVGALLPDVAPLLVAAWAAKTGVPPGSFAQFGDLIPGVTPNEADDIDLALSKEEWKLGAQFRLEKMSIEDGLGVIDIAWPRMAVETAVTVFKAAALTPTLQQLQKLYPVLQQTHLNALNVALSETAASPTPGHALARILRAGDANLDADHISNLILSIYPFLAPAQLSLALDYRPAALAFNGTSTLATIPSISASPSMLKDGFTLEVSVRLSTAQLTGYQPVLTLVHVDEVEGYTFDGPIIFPAGSPAVELGIQDGLPTCLLLLPKSWDLARGAPMLPAYVPFTASPALPPNNWSNISVTWTPDPSAVGQGDLTMTLNGQPCELVAPANQGGAPGPGTSLHTQALIPADYRAALGVAYSRLNTPGPPPAVRALAADGLALCDVRIWSPARPLADPQADPQPFGLTPGAAGLVDYWACDEGEGVVLRNGVGQPEGTVVDPVWEVGPQ